MFHSKKNFLGITLLGITFLNGCSQKFLIHEKSANLKQNTEFEKAVKIVEVPESPSSGHQLDSSVSNNLDSKSESLSSPASGVNKFTGANENSKQNKKAPSKLLNPSAATSPESAKEDLKSSKKEKLKKTSSIPSKNEKKTNLQKQKKTESSGSEESSSEKNLEESSSNSSGQIVASPVRQPEIESSIGFNGRRPIKDPFRVGEKVTHSVNYFSMKAGTLTLETRPFAYVNGVKNYQFRTSIKTVSLFDSFYSVDDYVDVLMDYQELVPSVFTLHVKESAQLKEAQMLFDFQKNKATYWAKKITEKDGEENKKLEWEIYPYAQNVFSAAFYMRNFQWEVGKENAFYVADDEKNLIFRAKALRREKLKTDIGTFDAIVIRPEIELKGKYNPVGENYIWLSDDDRKFILRIESKIKIGTLVSEVVSIDRGQE